MSPRPRIDHVRRPQILSAAAEAIHERGLEGTRIEDIARRAGTSAPNVLYWFDSKDALLEEALGEATTQFWARLVEELARFEGSRDKLVHYIERCAAPISPLHDWTLWIEIWSRALHDKAMRDATDRDARAWTSTLAEIIADGQERGEFADGDVDMIALSIIAFMDGLGVYVRLGLADVTPARMVELSLAFASRTLGCELAPRAPSSA
jgi:AcrR family transcriptional regulator